MCCRSYSQDSLPLKLSNKWRGATSSNTVREKNSMNQIPAKISINPSYTIIYLINA